MIDEDDDIEVIKLDQEACLGVCLELLAWIGDNSSLQWDENEKITNFYLAFDLFSEILKGCNLKQISSVIQSAESVFFKLFFGVLKLGEDIIIDKFKEMLNKFYEKVETTLL